MRYMNINVLCAHCGELLDTNEATKEDILPCGSLSLDGIELHVGTEHECFHQTEADTASDEN